MAVYDFERVRFEGEATDEVTKFVLRAHAITNIGWIIGTVAAIVLPLLVLAFFFVFSTYEIPVSLITIVLFLLAWYLVVLGVAFQSFLHWQFNTYILTNKRVVDIDFFGLFHRKVSQTHLGNIQDVTYSKAGLLQNFFDFGNLHLQTAGTQGEFEFHNIPDPEGSQKHILEFVSQYKSKIRGSYGPGSTESTKQ